jgi:hypothetical protein
MISGCPSVPNNKCGQSNDLRAILGAAQHDILLRNYQLSYVPRDICNINKHEQDIEFVVTRSASMVHAINLCETVDENLERILQEQRYSDEEASKLTPAFTFRLQINEWIFDARDKPEILELSRVLPETYKLKMYKYTPEEFKVRQESQKQVAH